MNRIKNTGIMSFVTQYVERRSRKGKFLAQMSLLLDWDKLSKELDKILARGCNAVGQKPYANILLFKMMLLGIWYKLSDEGVEDMVNDSFSATHFCDLSVEDTVPDHSTLSRFRNALVKKKSYDRLLRHINGQLEDRKVKVNTGEYKIDASITESPRCPKGRANYEIATDRNEDNRSSEDQVKEEVEMRAVKQKQPGVDGQARWTKKGGRYKFGFKRNDITDGDGLIEAVSTMPANQHDSKGLPKTLNQVRKGKIEELSGDKAYQTPTCNRSLAERGVKKNRLMKKGHRNRPLTSWERKYNRSISKTRWVVERSFGNMRTWFGAGVARYVGLEKTHAQHVMEAIAYNMKRSPGLVCQRSAQ